VPPHDLRGYALLFLYQAKQDVLSSDVAVVQLQRLPKRELQRLLRPGRERDVPGRLVLAETDHGLDFFACAVSGDAEALKSLARDAAGLAEQPEEHMLSADVVVLQLPGFLLRKHDNVPGWVSESLEHGTNPYSHLKPRQYHAINRERCRGLPRSFRLESCIVDWDDRLDEWELELDLAAQLAGSEWVTLERAAADTGASRAALRTWYRTGQIPSRLVDGPHGPQRLVPLALVAARAEASPRLRRTAERRLADEAQLEILRHRIDQLELRLAALERRQPGQPIE
jgi:transposase